MKEGLPRSACSARPLRDEGRPLQCCTPDWISAASVSTSTCSTRRVRRSRRVRRRPMPTAFAAWPLDWLVSAAGAGGDRVDERRPLRARPARAAGWEVEIADALKVKGLAPLACKTDRIDAWVLAELARRDLVPAIWLPDPEVRGRARAGPLPAASRPPPLQPQAARARGPARARQALPRLRPLRRLRPRAARAARAAASRGRPRRGEPAPDRRARPRDRRLRARAASARRRPPLRAAAAQRARDRLGARLHDRGRDRRHRPLPLPDQARRLHRALPARLPVRASPTGAARWPSRGPSTCAGRWSRPPSTPAPTPSTASATSARRRGSANSAAPASPRSTSPASSPRRSGTCSPATNPSLRQAPRPPGRLTARKEMRHRSEPPIQPDPPPRRR